MRKAKRARKVIIAIVVVVCVLGLMVGGLFIARNAMLKSGFYVGEDTSKASVGTVHYVVPEDGSTPYLYKTLDSGEIADDFKVMSTTDLHMHGEFTDFTLEVLGRFIDKEKPDLVVFVGDNVTRVDDTAVQKQISDFFEARRQYWAFVLGNHDGEGVKAEMGEEGGREWAFKTMLGSKYCIARDEGGDDVYGYGNYVVNIKNSKGIMQTLFFVDSGDNLTPEVCEEHGLEYKSGYAFIKNNQKAWYEQRLADVTEENGGVTPKSMMFAHIAFKEFNDVYQASKGGIGNKVKEIFAPLTGYDNELKGEIIYGDNWETFGSSPYSTGMFDLIVEKGSTQAVIFGHDHVNGVCVEYKGVKMLYSAGLQYETYNRRKGFIWSLPASIWYRIDSKACYYIDGVTIQTVRADGSVDIVPKYSQYEGVLDGLEDELKEASEGLITYKK